MSPAEDRHAVELAWDNGDATVIDVHPDRTILEAATAAGIDHRSGCESGRCSSCVGRLCRGSVRYINPVVGLTNEQRNQGFVLLCSAIPTANCRIDVGRSVLADAFPSLW